MKKKVLFLIGKLNGGGAERVLVDTLNNLNPDKYDITLQLVENEGDYVKDLAPYIHYKYMTTPEKPWQIKWFYRIFHHVPFGLVYKFFIRDNYDVEISFLEGLTTHILGCSTNRNSKKYAWVHTDMIENQWSNVDFKSEKQQNRIYHRFDRVLCVSEYCKSRLLERFGGDLPAKTIYNVVCDDVIRKKAERINSFVPNKRMFTFVSSGRLVRQKGYDRLLRILKKLRDAGYPCELWLLGDGIMREELEQYVLENQLEDTVHLLGFQSNPYPFIKAADCFVCSSRSEGYSTVVTEAFILGLPVVSVKCSGAEELLQDGQYGVLTENDEDALYKGMKLLLDDTSAYDKYCELAKERGTMFQKNVRIAEVEALLDE